MVEEAPAVVAEGVAEAAEEAVAVGAVEAVAEEAAAHRGSCSR